MKTELESSVMSTLLFVFWYLQVLSGGDADITVTVTAPSGLVAMHEYRQIEVTEEIQMNENGPYEVCFDNTFSRFTDKTVYFDLGIDETNKTGLDHDELTRGLVLPKDEYEHREQIMVSWKLCTGSLLYGQLTYFMPLVSFYTP